MTHTVVGIFNSAAEAQAAAQKLAAAGFTKETVDVANSRYGGRQTTDTTRTDKGDDDSISNFFRSLFGSDDADRYSRVARESGSIVTVLCHSDENAQQAAALLDDAGAIDVNERDAQLAARGNNQPQAGARQQQPRTDQRQTADADGQVSAKVIEENLQVGKRVEQTGGARLRSRIVERPVEANVRLREEHVTVDRNPVDRPATEADFNSFKEGQIEVTESAERAVVGKEARVVEEVTLGKEVSEREETIRETVRKTEVDVERLDGSQKPNPDRSDRSDQQR